VQSWPNDLPIQKATIEKIHVNCRMELAKDFPGPAMNMTVKVDDMVADHFVYRFRAYLAGMAAEEEVIRYPETWVDALKLAHAPAWVLRRWPVRYTTRCVKRYQTVCPHVALDDHSKHIHYLGAFPRCDSNE
jgi:hypothetical protein